MKARLRVLFGLWSAAALAACSLLSGLPTIPPGWTQTPSPAPSLTASPTSPPTPTPVPVARVEKGDQALAEGDFDSALAQYQAAYKDTTDPALRAAALWGQARVQYRDQRYVEALATTQQLIAESPEAALLAQAYFLQGEANYEMQRYAESAAAYQLYLTLRPGVIDAYVLERRGDALSAATNYADALAAYTAALSAARLDDGLDVQIKIAQARADIGDYGTALGLYDSIAAATTNDYIRAQMDYLAGKAYMELGRTDEAYGRYRHAVENYPLSSYSYLGLIELVNAGVQVSDLDRGLVDYFAGQYDVAAAAFDRYIAANPGNDGTPHYYRALALRELGNHQQAVDEFTAFITDYPSHARWADAWDEKAYTQWVNLGLYEDAAATLLEYVRIAPGSAQAPDELFSAGRILERDGRLDEAAAVWDRIGDAYPNNELATTGAFFAGILRYRQANYGAALTSFQRSLSLAVGVEDQTRANLWIGKAMQKIGDSAGTQAAWQQAQLADPGGYYSERARDLLLGRAPFETPPGLNLQIDVAAERRDADAWMRLTFNLPADTDLSGPGPLASDARLVRGTELWNLGEFQLARLELEDLRCELAERDGLNCLTLTRPPGGLPLDKAAVAGDAVLTYRLAGYLLDLGVYRSAIYATRQVLTLAGLEDHTSSMMAPPYFSHLRYGLYYSDLILPAAQADGLDPLFVFSVVRQESLFEFFVRSTADARGLMQIVPGTGAHISTSLGWPLDFYPEQLYRPQVNIRFGAYYLSSNRTLLSGDLYATLAAYNGGPGNAVIWKQLAGDDPDLLLETVRFEQTRDYIRNIYEIFVIYRRLYSPGS